MSDRKYDRLRHVSKAEKKRLSDLPEGEWFARIRVSMMESPAHRSLTLAAHRVLNRFVAEHVNHAQRENGRLKISYDQLVDWGLDRHAIRPALDELERLGFIECTSPGRRAFGPDPGWVACYRLTMFPVLGSEDCCRATDEWKRLSEEEVHAIQASLKDERALKKGRRRRPAAVADETVVMPFQMQEAA